VEGLSHRATVGQANQAFLVTVAILAGLVLLASPAHAARRYTTNAKSGTHHVAFSIRTTNENNGITRDSSGALTCTYELQFGNIGTDSGYWKNSPANTTLALETCTNGTQKFVWVHVGPSQSSRHVEPQIIAQEARDRLQVPSVRIASNPKRGLVGLESWFWLENGGRTLAKSLSRFGVRVSVTARPVSYRWDFGDGHEKITTSPGERYPRHSPITHIYQRSSAEYERGFSVSVTTVFQVRWRTNGSDWRALPSMSRTAERFYPVAESQAVNTDG
jgi:hypothetical protein